MLPMDAFCGPMESFRGILKQERYYGRRFTSKRDLVQMIETISAITISDGAALFGCLDAKGKAPAIFGCIKSSQQRMAAGWKSFNFSHYPFDRGRFRFQKAGGAVPAVCC